MDEEKVIKDIEECLSASCRGFRPRKLCPYNDDEWDIMRDALALLKEQKAIKPLFKTNPVTGTEQYLCGNCQRRFLFELDRYCPHCGRLVKWDD